MSRRRKQAGIRKKTLRYHQSPESLPARLKIGTLAFTSFPAVTDVSMIF